jgi:hypothetical protein
VGPWFTNAPVHEQFGSWTIRFTIKFSEQKTPRMANGVSDYEHAIWQQRASWEYQRGSQLLVKFGSVHVAAWIRRAFSWISLCFVLFFLIYYIIK